MFRSLKNRIGMSALALALMFLSGNALAATGTGPVTYFWYYANYYTLLVTAGGVSCGFTTNNIEPAKIAGAVAMLAAAKANGKNVTMSCDAGNFQLSM